MTKIINKKYLRAILLMTVILLLLGSSSQASIQGEAGTSFSLTARQGYIITSDGDNILMWGYTLGTNSMQYPGPTLLLNQGDTITITLKNELPEQAGNVSIVFPGHVVTATGGQEGLMTSEAAQTDNLNTPEDESTVVYTFTADEPGTYMYRSGSDPDLQVEMGLVGAIIVYPTGWEANDENLDGTPNLNHKAYATGDTYFGHEYLYLLTEMDPRIHRYVESGQWHLLDTSDYFPTNWFINGRNFPDILAAPDVPWLPNQPYNCQPRMHIGDTILIRMVGAGRDLHPMHYHGNDFDVIAFDGRTLSTGGQGTDADLRWKATTLKSVPGQTADMLWTWTGEELGWDIFDHIGNEVIPAGEPNEGTEICAAYDAALSAAGGDHEAVDPSLWFDPWNQEYCPDHGVPFPVIIPPRDDMAQGDYYSGSPFFGGMGELPPSHPALNSNAGYFYMWHSHTEKELTSNDIWPGGMVSFMIVEPSGVTIDE